ncbi:hypothetical protein DERP_012005 [Dermatophagoides pteronyssinus]|uniref:Uncharacterized protein n=1 Tax=Dermatophagoides pteronyssinus TaxID=6956 RepID=A0ABQ8IVN4_DERPT|nr:hypothetical protein DERP_012005 [Dermatophagoides pteronyssinus]
MPNRVKLLYWLDQTIVYETNKATTINSNINNIAVNDKIGGHYHQQHRQQQRSRSNRYQLSRLSTTNINNNNNNNQINKTLIINMLIIMMIIMFQNNKSTVLSYSSAKTGQTVRLHLKK